MRPLIYANENLNLKIMKIATDEKTKRHLENLGVLVGINIRIISVNHGSVILKVKNGRLALNQSLATQIFVE